MPVPGTATSPTEWVPLFSWTTQQSHETPLVTEDTVSHTPFTVFTGCFFTVHPVWWQDGRKPSWKPRMKWWGYIPGFMQCWRVNPELYACYSELCPPKIRILYPLPNNVRSQSGCTTDTRKQCKKMVVVSHAWNPGPGETKAGGFSCVQRQPGLWCKPLSQHSALSKTQNLNRSLM